MNTAKYKPSDIEEMEEIEAGEVEDDAGLKHQKLQQQVEKVMALVLDQKGERQHLKVPTTPVLASKMLSKSMKHAPVKQTQEQEKEVYGWVFVGCGQKEGYDVMTKLGEGMFGYVIHLFKEQY